jgi:phosphopantetheine adenylyltransferase
VAGTTAFEPVANGHCDGVVRAVAAAPHVAANPFMKMGLMQRCDENRRGA